jgi:hypothetical protein
MSIINQSAMEKQVTHDHEVMEERKALSEEFWVDNTSELAHQKLFRHNRERADISVTSAVCEVALTKENCDRVVSLCNNSKVLVFNFYATTLALLLDNYFQLGEVHLLCPYGQFDKGGNEDALFLFRTRIQPNSSFKELFADNKSFLIESLQYPEGHSFIEEKISSAVLREAGAFSLSINYEGTKENEPGRVFRIGINYNTNAPFLRIEFDSTFFDKPLIGLFGNNFNNILDEIIQFT